MIPGVTEGSGDVISEGVFGERRSSQLPMSALEWTLS